MKQIEIYWNDLTDKKKQEIIKEFGDNNNWDVYPMCIIDIEEEDQ